MGFVFAVRQGCRELVSAVGQVSQRTGFKRRSRSIQARSLALRFIAPDVDLEISASNEEARSILYAVMYALGRYPLRRLLKLV